MIQNLLRKNIRNLKPYSSARNEFDGEGSTFLDANENAMDLEGNSNGLNRYPFPLQRRIRSEISRIKSVSENQIFIGNGSDEAIDLLFRCFCEPARSNALIFPPTYGMYSVCAAINDVKITECQLNENFSITSAAFKTIENEKPNIIFICNPNNPTGNLQSHDTIRKIIESANGIVVVDEAYIDFCPEQSVLPWINLYPNLVVCQTLSKAWGLAAARIGLAFASPQIIEVLNRVKFPYNVGKPSAEMALKALGKQEIMLKRVAEVVAERQRLFSNLQKNEMVSRVYPSQANFLLVKVQNANETYSQLLKKGIVVRNRTNEPGCENCLRITVGAPFENELLLNALK